MITDTSEFIFFKVPIEWAALYQKLCILMTEHGIDIIKDCNANCSSSGKKLLQCWFNFNAACAAYENHQETEARVLLEIIIDCLNNTYNTNFDIDDFFNKDFSNLPTIITGDVGLFIIPFVNYTNCNDFDELAEKVGGDPAALVALIKDGMTRFAGDYFNEASKLTQYIVGNEYLITMHTVYTDVFVIRVPENYMVTSVSYQGTFKEEYMYRFDEEISPIDFVTVSNGYRYLYIFNNDKSTTKIVKIKLIKQ